MNNSYLSKSLIHNAVGIGLDTLADKYMPTDKSKAVIEIELYTRFSSTHSRSTKRDIGLSYGDEIASDIFWTTRHNLSICTIKLAPKTDVLLGDWRMFGKIFKVHNGSDKPHTFSFSTYKPTIHSIKVVEGNDDGKMYDSYNWGWYIFNTKTFSLILILVLIIAIIVATVIHETKPRHTNPYTAPATPTRQNDIPL